MAKVKITGHASGSGVVTVTAPNTSTDRTITLPDATATLATKENFLSTGIDDNASAVKLTVSDSGINVNGAVTSAVIKEVDAGNVGFGVVPAAWHSSYTALQIGNQGSITQDASKYFRLSNNVADTGSNVYIATDEASSFQQFNGTHNFYTAPSGSAGATISWTSRLNITNDGRGLSQFTAKAWIRLDMSNMSVPDSHNVSSVTDIATGKGRVNFANNMGNSSYNISTSSNDGGLAAHSNISVGSFYLRAASYSGSDRDDDYTMALVFGD
jgi:hypothetical protein|tara:strand:- start:29 stop:838 length:810 start_codon:yes stop_codon:yes gene_type:complete